MWTATRGEDVLSVLVVEPDGLRLSATVPCGGHWPRDITVSDGFLYAANERSGDVTWFALDPATGIPRRTGSPPRSRQPPASSSPPRNAAAGRPCVEGARSRPGAGPFTAYA
ncbi:hypothetical protein SVIOM342S_10030 [Streptomyces violaceorubidus]